MNFKRLLHTQLGITFVSIMLGLGLATLFRKVCTDKSCIIFNGPVIHDVTDKTFKYDEKCYQYEAVPTTCDQNKRIIDIRSPDDPNDAKPITGAPAPSASQSNGFFGF